MSQDTLGTNRPCALTIKARAAEPCVERPLLVQRRLQEQDDLGVLLLIRVEQVGRSVLHRLGRLSDGVQGPGRLARGARDWHVGFEFAAT
jgi:hypothetical protein